MSDDAELLRRYAEEGSEAAFAELVRRRIDFVYAVALRQVGHDTHLASDVAQAVFVDLARKARALRTHPTLASWLYTSTRFAAARARLRQARWLKRNEEARVMNDTLSPESDDAAWTQIRPVLDDAMHELPERDRTAIVLRFFDGLAFADVGARLGLAENSARMRVDRALDKLRLRLARRGIVSTAAALGSTLAAQPAVPAPAGLAGVVTGAAVSGGVTGGIASTVGMIFMTTQSKVVIATILLAVLAGFGGYQWKSGQPASVPPSERALGSRRTPSVDSRPANSAGRSSAAPEETPRSSPSDAEPSRLETVRALRERGVTVAVRLFDPSGLNFTTEARDFFRLSDAEVARLLEVFRLRNQEMKEISMSTAEITSNDGQKIVLTVPPEHGRKVMDAFRDDLTQLLGAERTAEFMEVGTNEIAIRLSNDGTGGRTLDITRATSLPTAEDIHPVPLFRIVEPAGTTILTRFSEIQNRDGSPNMLTRFGAELKALTIAPPPPGLPGMIASDGVAR